MTYDICIRGAGIVGRCLALLLAQQRWRVALVQAPHKASAPDVRAYALNAQAKAMLETLRCWPESPAVTPVQAMQVWGDQGGHLRFEPPQPLSALHWMVDVPALEHSLTTAVSYASQIELLTQAVPAPLTLVCEGRASQTRCEFGVDFEVQHYPHHAIAARLHSPQPHQGLARQWFGFDGQGQSDIVALLPLGGEGGHELALVWSAHPTRAAELAAMDADAFCQALQNTCQHSLSLRSERAVWPLQLARASRWIGPVPGHTHSSFALAGDAAHTMHPLAGQGLNIGLGDVDCLARVIREKEYWRPLHDLKLLRRYERARAAQVQAMSCVTDGLQRLFSPTDGLWPQVRNWGLSGFDRSGPIKHWVSRHAMGLPALRKTTP